MIRTQPLSIFLRMETYGTNWVDLQMKYTLDLFIGYRIGIYYYSETEAGGYADFRNFVYYEADDIERQEAGV